MQKSLNSGVVMQTCSSWHLHVPHTTQHALTHTLTQYTTHTHTTTHSIPILSFIIDTLASSLWYKEH